MINFNIKFINTPIRIAKKSSDEILVFNTSTFEQIFLDDLSFHVFSNIKDNLITNIYSLYNDTIQYCKESGNNIDIKEDFNKFIDFLIENQFVEKC